jgi:hypothetical protein
MMNDEQEGIRKEVVIACLKYCCGFTLAGRQIKM